MKTSILFFLILSALYCQDASAQYFIPNQAWGGGQNIGYGAQNNNNYFIPQQSWQAPPGYGYGYNMGINNGFNRGTDFYAGDDKNRKYQPTLPKNSGFNKSNTVTDENRYFYPQVNKSQYPPQDPPRQRGGIAHRKYVPTPNVRGVNVPPLPTYSRSAGTRK